MYNITLPLTDSEGGDDAWVATLHWQGEQQQAKDINTGNIKVIASSSATYLSGVNMKKKEN